MWEKGGNCHRRHFEREQKEKGMDPLEKRQRELLERLQAANRRKAAEEVRAKKIERRVRLDAQKRVIGDKQVETKVYLPRMAKKDGDSRVEDSKKEIKEKKRVSLNTADPRQLEFLEKLAASKKTKNNCTSEKMPSNTDSLNRVRWAQRHRIAPDTPVFICPTGYPAIKAELKSRGWFENPDPESDVFDFFYAMKLRSLTKGTKRKLKDGQIANRFMGSGELCSKAGLAKNIGNVKWLAAADHRSFFPRCYVLARSDVHETLEFITDFKVSAAETIVRAFLEKIPFNFNHILVRTAIRVIEGFANRFDDAHLDSELDLPIASLIDWAILVNAEADLSLRERFIQRVSYFARMENASALIESCQANQEHLPQYSDGCEKEIKKYNHFQAKQLMKAAEEDRLGNACIFEAKDIQELQTNAANALQAIQSFRGPEQTAINGMRNAWIVKPAGKSRGNGIRCFSDLEEIFRYTRTNSQDSSGWVVQKYIENCLTVHRRKFDIRQWVIVTNWNPLTIYFFDDCYLRFCVEEYSLDNLEDRFIHLANNSVSKQSEKFSSGPIEGNMWSKDDFLAYLASQGLGNAWDDKIKLVMHEIVKLAISCVQESIEARTDSFELFGFDFMIDEDLNPWLIEVNSSPSMEYSTKVTKSLAEEALKGLVGCILDGKYETVGNNQRRIRENPVAEIGKWKLLFHDHISRRPKLDSNTQGLIVKSSTPLHWKKRL